MTPCFHSLAACTAVEGDPRKLQALCPRPERWDGARQGLDSKRLPRLHGARLLAAVLWQVQGLRLKQPLLSGFTKDKSQKFCTLNH